MDQTSLNWLRLTSKDGKGSVMLHLPSGLVIHEGPWGTTVSHVGEMQVKETMEEVIEKIEDLYGKV